MATTFRRMDESTQEQWAEIGAQTITRQARAGEQVLNMLRFLQGVTDGFNVDQLEHCLQTATRAERAGASDEMVVASLCHDIGKFVSVPNHGAIAAEILRPYVSDDVAWVIEVHQDFQGRHYYEHFHMDPDLREQHRGHPAYGLAEQFADDWDQTAFDETYDSFPLEHFEERVMKLFASPHRL